MNQTTQFPTITSKDICEETRKAFQQKSTLLIVKHEGESIIGIYYVKQPVALEMLLEEITTRQ